MTTDRDLLLVAFTAFLSGIVFTLFVLLFLDQKAWYARLVILGVLTMLTAISLAVTHLVMRGRLKGEQVAVLQDGSSPAKNSTLHAAPAATAPPSPANDSNPQGRKPEPTRREASPARAENVGKGRSSAAVPLVGPATMEQPLGRRDTEPEDYYRETEPGAGASTYSAAYSAADPGRLVEIWESYRKKGEGKFSAQGLRQKIEAAGISAEVLPGEQFGAADNFLAVDFRGGGPLYLLPNFNKPARTVSQWFQALGPESRTAIIQRLIRPATARRSGGRLEIETRGEIE